MCFVQGCVLCLVVCMALLVQVFEGATLERDKVLCTCAFGC